MMSLLRWISANDVAIVSMLGALAITAYTILMAGLAIFSDAPTFGRVIFGFLAIFGVGGFLLLISVVVTELNPPKKSNRINP